MAAPAVRAAQTLIEELAWAYAISPGTAPPPVDDGTRYSLPGSDRQFTLDQIRNRMGPADWYPGDHPSMPPIVAVGREAAGIWACSLCHYPNGKGRPENASVVGFPKEYFIQQMYDFKNGLRESAEPRKPNTPLMTGFAVAMTDDEIRAAAEYFSAMPLDAVDRGRRDGHGAEDAHRRRHALEARRRRGRHRAARARIVESPVNAEHTELLRDPRSGFIAYVPKGSVARGEALARDGKEGVAACTVCHGENLDGLAMVPSLRGRSPSYIARQLADMKTASAAARGRR